MINMNELTVTAPQFDLYEPVTVQWDGVTHHCRVVCRWLDLDNGRWFYELDNFKNPHDPRGWFESISLDRG